MRNWVIIDAFLKLNSQAKVSESSLNRYFCLNLRNFVLGLYAFTFKSYKRTKFFKHTQKERIVYLVDKYTVDKIWHPWCHHWTSTNLEQTQHQPVNIKPAGTRSLGRGIPLWGQPENDAILALTGKNSDSTARRRSSVETGGIISESWLPAEPARRKPPPPSPSVWIFGGGGRWRLGCGSWTAWMGRWRIRSMIQTEMEKQASNE